MVTDYFVEDNSWITILSNEAPEVSSAKRVEDNSWITILSNTGIVYLVNSK